MFRKISLVYFTLSLCFKTLLISEEYFSNQLPLKEQVALLPSVDNACFEKFLTDHPEIIYIGELHVPIDVEVILGKHLDSKIVSKKAYKPGDVLYDMNTLLFREDQMILAHCKDTFVLFENVVHTVRRENDMREFYYFESFMNHSCDPNTITFYTSTHHYETRALKPIAPGDELTCDYGVFDTDADGEGYKCLCGSANCRGWVY